MIVNHQFLFIDDALRSLMPMSRHPLLHAPGVLNQASENHPISAALHRAPEADMLGRHGYIEGES